MKIGIMNEVRQLNIKKQAQTVLPTVGDATLVDDTVALVDDSVALVGGQAATTTVAKSRTRVDAPIVKIKIRH